MGLFGKKNKEEATQQTVEATTCSCSGNCDTESKSPAENQEIAKNQQTAENKQTDGASVKILGSGCSKCNQLEAATKEALKQLGMDSAIDHITDFSQIAAYGVMTTPALVVDGKVVSYGKVLKVDEVVKLLNKR